VKKRIKINTKHSNKTRYIKEIIDRRFNIMIVFCVIIFSFLSISLVTLQIGNKDLYQAKLIKATEKIIESNSVPRGRIYDRNYNLLVDNVGKKTIYYKKPKGITTAREIELAYQMADVLDVPYDKLYKINLKEFWLANNKKLGREKITEEEYQKYNERKLSLDDLEKLKIERITDDELNAYNDLDKEAAYIYYLMNKGYYYDEKIIKNTSVTDFEYAHISENITTYEGFNTKLDWERKYLYGDVLRGILGTVSDYEQGIPYELKNHYLEKGYALNDRVGLSNLEYQYEDLLKGTKSIYKSNADNSLELIKAGYRGKDLVLTIDINLQMEVEKIIEELMIKAKGEPNTEYFNKVFVILSEPKTGSILAYVGKQIVNKDGKYVFYDYAPHLSTTTIIPGSVVKGASMAVGYNTKAISIGTRMLDECVKIKNTPEKCSWRSGLGVLDDITALKLSSNSYQFKIAMKVGKGNYRYNAPLAIDIKAFDTYRDMFAKFGLGVKTEIDLPNETAGYKGSSTATGHLLDFSIGQYDTYTPLQLSQYINTIANGGKRIALHFLKEVRAETMTEELGKIEEVYEPKVINNLDIDSKYIERIQKGFREVVRTGLGYGYMGKVPNGAGKTGTSQSFIDSDNDGKIDKETLSNSFIGYYPVEDPIMSIAVVTPDVSHIYGRSSYKTNIIKAITSQISNKFFDIYK